MSRIVIAKSVRASCAIDQNPFSNKMGILVVDIAVIIIMSTGIAAILTENPIKIRVLHTISNEATNAARNSGFEKPIFSKRPAPVSYGFCTILYLKQS
jgi:hypothetical protein